MSVDFEREKQWWDAKAPIEDKDRRDEAVNRALRWRELERRLDNVRTILEVGGGAGAFSIPLARQGFVVTHLDLSPAMLEKARQKAEGLANISFVEGNAVDLSQFADCSFDLVLNMDGAVSFCGAEAARAISESCRVTKKTLILTVSHRAQMVPVWVSSSLTAAGRFLPAVEAMLVEGRWHQEQYPENRLLTEGLTQNYMGTMKAYLPGELRESLERHGMAVQRCGGLGTLAGLVGEEAIDKVHGEERLWNEFLDLCERYDRDILPGGLGTKQRAGLIAVATKRGTA
ncbi:MAG: class I SAM-dependent methyltransferase [Anaerolineales bacterium]|nr:class I SAM-dependent methyltransferase [Anaerolineales bacterium]